MSYKPLLTPLEEPPACGGRLLLLASPFDGVELRPEEEGL
jgi:hypothetical protein